MAIRWEAEACELARDPESGARITRLTSSVMSNINIYYEQPYSTPDGARVLYLRASSSDPRLPPGQQLCVADLRTCKIAMLDDRVWTHWVATSPWSGHAFYLRDNGELIHLDLATLEKRIALTHWPLAREAYLWSVTPDLRSLITLVYDAEFHCNVIRIDLEKRQWAQIYRHPMVHGHVQVSTNGRDILLQRNRGTRQNHLRQRRTEPSEHPGATHVVIDLDGGNERPLHIGEPWTAPSTGHASWVAQTGRMATPVGTAGGIHVGDPDNVPPVIHDPRHSEGNFLALAPGDDAPKVFPAPTHVFNHASVSRCGRYFVADCFCHGVPGPIEIVVGDMQTGRHRVLVRDCGAQGGGPACSHPHPYFTADTQHVIYNADPHCVCHLHMARLPEGFLPGLA